MFLTAVGTAAADEPRPGILLLAHGGSAKWNDSVRALAAKVDAQQPTEVAFGMASRPAIQTAVDRLVERGASSVVAVPLFVSSHSSVITSTEYLLGLRSEAPADLAVFARMKHGHGAAEAGHHHEGTDNTRPVDSRVPIRMAPALGRHPVVSDILLTRATAISHHPSEEALVIVAHGPVPEEDNRAWLADMGVVAGRIREGKPFASVDWLTVRDDVPAPIRDAATAELRALVQRLQQPSAPPNKPIRVDSRLSTAWDKSASGTRFAPSSRRRSSPSSPSCRWRSASGRTPRSSRCSTRCCSGPCRCRSPSGWST